MADIDILVNSSQVKSAKQELQELGNSFNSASKSASVFMQAFERAAKQSQRDEQYIRQTSQTLQRLITDNLKITNSYKSAQDSATAFTTELRKQEEQALKTARANQDAINKQFGVSAPSATSSGAGYGALEAEILRLETMYNKVAVAAKVYEQAQESLNRAVLMGVITADEQKAKLNEMSIAYQKVGNSADNAQAFINRFGENAQVAGRGLNNFGMYAQQVGYQVGDFFVQVQSGTNVLVAFGQQATQLAGLIPGVLGAALGIGISLVTAIGAAFMRSGESARNSSKDVEAYTKAVTAATNEISSLNDELLEMRYPDLSDAERQIVAQIAVVEQIKAAHRGDTERVLKLAELNSLLEEVRKKQEILAISNSEMARFEERRRQIAESILQPLRAEAENRERIKRAYAEQLAYMGKSKQESERFKEGLVGASEAARQVAQTMFSNISFGADEALRMARNLTQASLNYGKLVNRGESGPDAARRSVLELNAPGLLTGTVASGAGGVFVPENVGGSGGGGGGAVQEDALQKLREQIALENELLGVSEAQKRVIQALGEQRSQYSEAEINAVTAEIEAYNQKLEVLKQQQELADVLKSSMEDAFMSIIEGTESAKDAFKKMAYEVIKELYRVLVVQRLVGSFNSQTGTGTGLVGLIAGAFRESGGSVMAGQPYIVGERGPELVIPRHSGTVMNANLTKQVASGGGDINVTNVIQVPAGADSASIRAEVSKMIPQITQITKAAVIDAKQRGGQMAAAFR